VDSAGKRLFSEDVKGGYKVIEGRKFIMTDMLFGNGIRNASAVVFKKRLLKIPFPSSITRLRYCGDWLCWVQILRHSNLWLLDENLNSFRRHTQNVSGKAETAGLFYLEGIQVYGQIRRYFPNHFNFIDNNDKTWASDFVKKEFSIGKIIRFATISAGASLLIPVYVAWYECKKLSKKWFQTKTRIILN
jgi:hypothetical protein